MRCVKVVLVLVALIGTKLLLLYGARASVSEGVVLLQPGRGQWGSMWLNSVGKTGECVKSFVWM